MILSEIRLIIQNIFKAKTRTVNREGIFIIVVLKEIENAL